jgi:hypothetical protein
VRLPLVDKGRRRAKMWSWTALSRSASETPQSCLLPPLGAFGAFEWPITSSPRPGSALSVPGRHGDTRLAVNFEQQNTTFPHDSDSLAPSTNALLEKKTGCQSFYRNSYLSSPLKSPQKLAQSLGRSAPMPQRGSSPDDIAIVASIRRAACKVIHHPWNFNANVIGKSPWRFLSGP